MNDTVQFLQNNVSSLQNDFSVEKVNKGYSEDEKYIVYSHDRKYLLRVGDVSGYEKKKSEFQVMKKLRKMHVQCPEPIDVGVSRERRIFYSLYSYIEGNDGIEVLNELNAGEQRKIGLDAGRQLSRMHSLKAPWSIDSWYQRAMEKHYRYLEAYKGCEIKISNDDKIIEFIEKNKYLLKDRPNCFQHDDFHLGNIIVNNKKYAGAIDFDNYDWGDPIHDFVKVALFQRELSVPFSIGQMKGYFNGNVPENFWSMYSIYNAMVLFSSVVWSVRFAPSQIDEMLSRIHKIIEDHKGFELSKPTWFE